VKRLVLGRWLTILTFSLLGATATGSFGAFTAGEDSQLLTQALRAAPTTGRTQGRASRSGKQFGTESFVSIRMMEMNLDSAVVELHRNDSGNHQATVGWRISCDDSQGPDKCNSADLKIEFRVECGVLRIWDTLHPRQGLARPKLEVTVSHSSDQSIQANIQNGIFQSSSPPRLELILGNGSASLLGDLDNTSAVRIKNGSVDIDCFLSKGKHEFKIENGSAQAHFKKGSSFRYVAHVQTGSVGIDRPATISSDQDFANMAEGAVGGGVGELKIEIGVGSVDLAFL
jgi:hypothetical protein